MCTYSGGYVYVLENPSFKENIYKIGKSKDHPTKRADQLYDTGVPTQFIIKYMKYTDRYEDLENFLHDQLKDKRINPNREFFNVSLKEITDLVNIFEKDGYITLESEDDKLAEDDDDVMIRIFPHSRDEEHFPTKQSLYNLFLDKIKNNIETYSFGDSKSIGQLPAGTIVWIKYEGDIIGEFKVKRGIEEQTINGKTIRTILIDLNSIILYATPISYYDYLEFEGKKPYHGAYHRVRKSTYDALTAMLY